MTEGPGKATGPQRRRTKQEGVAPPPRQEPEVTARTAEQRQRAAYNAVCERIAEQLDLARMRMDEVPGGTQVEVVTEALLAGLMDLERRVTNVRVDLDQLGCSL